MNLKNWNKLQGFASSPPPTFSGKTPAWMSAPTPVVRGRRQVSLFHLSRENVMWDWRTFRTRTSPLMSCQRWLTVFHFLGAHCVSLHGAAWPCNLVEVRFKTWSVAEQLHTVCDPKKPFQVSAKRIFTPLFTTSFRNTSFMLLSRTNSLLHFDNCNS